MSKAIGGYVRRSERRYAPPAPDDPRPRCGPCGALLWRLPHVCEEVTFETPLMLDNVTAPVSPLKRAPDFHVPPGEIMASILGAPEQPGPPWVHTFAPPEPIGQDEDGNDIYPEPGPAHTLTEGR